MDSSLLILGLSFAVGLSLSAFFHIWFQHSEFLRENFLAAAFAVATAATSSIVALTLFFWNDADFVGNISLAQYLLSLSCGLLIIPALLIPVDFISICGVMIASFLGVYISGITIIFYPELPEWLNMFFTSLLLGVFACGFYAVSGLTPFPQSQGMISSAGFIILALLGFAPVVMGISAAVLFGVLLVSYARGTLQPMNHLSTMLIGYIIGWLGLISYPEYLLPSFVVFMMYYISECFVAVFCKLTTLPQFAELPYNSTLYRAFDESGSQELVSRMIGYTGILLIILGVFQTNSDNCYSFPIFAAMLCGWQQYRTLNWQTPDKTLKETNREVIDSVKKSFNVLFGDNKNSKHTDDEQ